MFLTRDLNSRPKKKKEKKKKKGKVIYYSVRRGSISRILKLFPQITKLISYTHLNLGFLFMEEGIRITQKQEYIQHQELL